MDSVVAVLAAEGAIKPLCTAVDDIVAIAGLDFNIVGVFDVSAYVDDIGITPEVFIEGVVSVLVVAKDIDIVSGGGGTVGE